MLSTGEYQDLLLPIFKKYDIKRAAIFGSVAKGNTHKGSDFDLLIEPQKGFTLFGMLELEEELADLLDTKVDLVEYDALKASIRAEVLQTAVTIL